MPRHLVCLTYDFDGLNRLRSAGTTRLSSDLDEHPTSWFGQSGLARIRNLLYREDIRATFFASGTTLNGHPEIGRALIADGHEIGHSGWTHPRPHDLDRSGEEEELLRGIDAIGALTGRAPSGYRSPSWEHSANTVDLLLAHGFVYDSSLMAHDHRPYRARVSSEGAPAEQDVLGRPTKLIEMPVSWSMDDYALPELSEVQGGLPHIGLKSPRELLYTWCEDFDTMADSEDWGVIVYTFHPGLSGHGQRLVAMERLIGYLKSAGAQFVTLSEAAEEARSHIDPLT